MSAKARARMLRAQARTAKRAYIKKAREAAMVDLRQKATAREAVTEAEVAMAGLHRETTALNQANRQNP